MTAERVGAAAAAGVEPTLITWAHRPGRSHDAAPLQYFIVATGL